MEIESEFGHTLSYPLRFQNRKHFTVDLFEIRLISSNGDAILPSWWIVEHPPLRPYGPPDDIQFTQCKGCSAQNANELSLEINSDVLDNPEPPIIGSISSLIDRSSLHLISIGWCSKYQADGSLSNGVDIKTIPS
jgi:hypothetical protein